MLLKTEIEGSKKEERGGRQGRLQGCNHQSDMASTAVSTAELEINQVTATAHSEMELQLTSGFLTHRRSVAGSQSAGPVATPGPSPPAPPSCSLCRRGAAPAASPAPPCRRVELH